MQLDGKGITASALAVAPGRLENGVQRRGGGMRSGAAVQGQHLAAL